MVVTFDVSCGFSCKKHSSFCSMELERQREKEII